jgi:hypothetical protein
VLFDPGFVKPDAGIGGNDVRAGKQPDIDQHHRHNIAGEIIAKAPRTSAMPAVPKMNKRSNHGPLCGVPVSIAALRFAAGWAFEMERHPGPRASTRTRKAAILDNIFKSPPVTLPMD